MKLRLEEDGETREVEAEDFERDNADDPELCALVRSLRVGEAVAVGGGAWALVQIERLA